MRVPLAMLPQPSPRPSSLPTIAQAAPSQQSYSAGGAPGAHLHVVTLLLLHLRVDAQLLPGTQHTHPGAGGRGTGPKVQRAAHSAVRQHEGALPHEGTLSEWGHSGAPGTWASRQPKGVTMATLCPGLGGTTSAVSLTALNRGPGEQRDRQGKQHRGGTCKLPPRPHWLCAPSHRRREGHPDSCSPAGSNQGSLLPSCVQLH